MDATNNTVRAADSRKGRLIKAAMLAALIAPVGGYAGWLVYGEASAALSRWQAGAPERERARERDRRWDEIDAIATRLEGFGATFPAGKHGRYARVDLSEWRGSPADLAEISRLGELRAQDIDYIRGVRVKLGPAIDGSFLSVLGELEYVEGIDLNGSRLTDAEVASLLRALPGCAISRGDHGALWLPAVSGPVEASHPIRPKAAP